MLFELILLLISYYYLHHGVYPLLTGKPAIKRDAVRKTIVVLVVIELMIDLFAAFLVLVSLYGYSSHGFTVGDSPIYVLLFLASVLILWIFYCLENDPAPLKQSLALVAVHPDYAMLSVHETLKHLNLDYQEILSGFQIPSKQLSVTVTLTGECLRFSVSKPLDKLFLNQLCRNYRLIYQRQQFPIARKFACLSTLLGFSVLLIAIANLYVYWVVIGNIVQQIISIAASA